MSEEKKELKKNLKNEELCEGKQKLSIEELEQVTGGGPVLSGPLSGPMLGVTVKADGIVKASGTIDGQAYAGTNQS